MSKEIVCDICKDIMGNSLSGFVVYRRTWILGLRRHREQDICDSCVSGMRQLAREKENT